VIARLEKRLGVPILNLAKAGDEVRFMLGVEQRAQIVKRLTKGCPAGGPWDLLLFSGGGNDIVDNPMMLWVNDYSPNTAPNRLLNKQSFAHALGLLQAGYEQLIEVRDRISPTTHLVFHAYDYAIPDGRGVCTFGPWLEPTFDARKFPKALKLRFEVVKEMLTQFARLLHTLASNHNDVTFINGQGTLPEKTDWWHNELHPSTKGFDMHAELFHLKIKALFQGRVL